MKKIIKEIRNHPSSITKKELLESLIRNYAHVAVSNDDLVSTYLDYYLNKYPEWNLWEELKNIQENDFSGGTYHSDSRSELIRLFIKLLEKEVGKKVETTQRMYEKVKITYV